MMKIRLSNSDHFHDAFQLLYEEPVCNLYQLDLLKSRIHMQQLEWTAVYQNTKMIAVCVSSNRFFPGFPARMSVPYGDSQACTLLGQWEQERGGTLNIFAEEKASRAFYEGLGTPQAFIDSRERLFFADFKPEQGTYLPLRCAHLEEWERLIDMAAQMQQEDLGIDPLRAHPESFRVTFQTRLKEKRVLVGEVEGQVGFMIDVGTRCKMGTQVGSIFVPDTFRGQGLAVRGVRGCLQFLISGTSFVSLLCRESNIPAIKTHRRTGFTEGMAFRMISMHPQRKA